MGHDSSLQLIGRRTSEGDDVNFLWRTSYIENVTDSFLYRFTFPGSRPSYETDSRRNFLCRQVLMVRSCCSLCGSDWHLFVSVSLHQSTEAL